jgi:hypothetical protein
MYLCVYVSMYLCIYVSTYPCHRHSCTRPVAARSDEAPKPAGAEQAGPGAAVRPDQLSVPACENGEDVIRCWRARSRDLESERERESERQMQSDAGRTCQWPRVSAIRCCGGTSTRAATVPMTPRHAPPSYQRERSSKHPDRSGPRSSLIRSDYPPGQRLCR